MADMNHTRIGILSIDSAPHSSGGSVPGIQTGPTSVNTWTGSQVYPSTNTFTGQVVSTATVNLQAAKTLSKQTTVSGTSLVLADGEIAVTNVSTTSATIQIRSGVTVYTFRADAAAVL
jgi:hypothetical protein